MSDKGLIALHVDYHVVLLALFAVCLPAAIRTATVLRRGHYTLATKGLNSCLDALVIGSYDDTLHNARHLLIHVLDNLLATQHSQWLGGKTRRGIACGDDCYKFQFAHIYTISMPARVPPRCA